MPKAKPTTALTKADIPTIIQRYINGESIQAIAKDAQVARNTIYQWMHGIGDARYPELVTQAMIARMALADHQLDTAQSHEDIARAREACKFTRWDLERRRPRTWGVRAEITMTGPAAIYLGLAEPAIETTCTQLTQAEEQADESNRVNP
jgi:hypothetical protein